MSAATQSARRPASAFISYARKDGEAFARDLRGRIEREHPDIYLWQDRNELRGGIGWWQQIEEALQHVSFLISVMTPAALASDTTRKEWQYARQQGVCVFPVKGVPDAQLDYKAMPKWMSKAHFYDLAMEWETFIRHLKSPCTQTRVPFMAPDLPEHFVPRPREFDALLARVLDRRRQEPIAVATSLHGAGGFGKTTLAKALCHNDDVITAFTDGILWVTLGQTPDLRRELTRLHRALTGEDREFLDAEEAAQQLAQRLADKLCLIVVDDVWKRQHLEPFLRGGETCTRLVTTRVFQVVTQTADPVKVDEMQEQEAMALLLSALKDRPQELGPFGELARRLGEWPLLLRLAASAIQARVARGEPTSKALDYVDRALAKKGIAAFDRTDAGSRDDAVVQTVGVSLGLLADEDRSRCDELAVFPDDAEIPLSALAALWRMDQFDAEECAQRLSELALIDLDLGRGIATVHDVMRKFFAGRLADAPAAHLRLVASWGDPRKIAEPYALRWLCYHLAEAKQFDTLRGLLLDYRWLAHKLETSGVNALLHDFGFGPPDPLLLTVQEALRQAGHILGHEGEDWTGRNQFASQLLARLLHRNEPEIRGLLSDACDARREQGEAWLRPCTASLRATSALLRTLAGHSAGVNALVRLRDGRLVSASVDKTIKLWNLANGECDATLQGHDGWVTALALLPDGRLVSTSHHGWESQDNTIKLWNLASGECEGTLWGHGDGVSALALLADGRLASGSYDKTVKLWNLASGECEATLEHRDRVLELALLPDGRLASGSWDKTIEIWDLATRKPELTLTGHGGFVTALARLPDGRLASGSADNTIKLWNLASGECEATLRGHGGGVSALALLPDGRLASGSRDRSIKLWNLQRAECQLTLQGHGVGVNALLPLADGRLASASGDRTIKLWDLARPHGGAMLDVDRHENSVEALAPLPGGRLASGSDDRTIKLWSLPSGKREETFEHSDGVFALALLPDGRLASGSRDHIIRLWNVARGECEATLEGHGSAVSALAVLPSGQLASGSWDRRVKLWNSASRRCEATLEGHADVVSALAPLPDGRVASGSWDKTIKLWNLASGECEATLEGHGDWVRALALLDDGRLASGSQDNTVKFWDLATGKSEATLQGSSYPVNALAVLPNARIVSGSRDNMIRVWSSEGDVWRSTVAFVGEAAIGALAYLAGEQIVAAGDAAGRVHFLKLEGAEPRKPVR